MKELDLLKEDWKKKQYPKVSAQEIYAMLLKKSSSVVKWIFYISVIELSFGLIGGFFYKPDQELAYYFPQWLSISTSIFVLVVAIYFINRFYRNYKAINTTSSVKELLNNIIKTRKTVKLYVVINVLFFAIISSLTIIYALTEPFGEEGKIYMELTTVKDYFLLALFVFLGTLFLVSICLVLYFLMYGLLMRKLNKNYKELKKLDM